MAVSLSKDIFDYIYQLIHNDNVLRLNTEYNTKFKAGIDDGYGPIVMNLHGDDRSLWYTFPFNYRILSDHMSSAIYNIHLTLSQLVNFHNDTNIQCVQARKIK